MTQSAVVHFTRQQEWNTRRWQEKKKERKNILKFIMLWALEKSWNTATMQLRKSMSSAFLLDPVAEEQMCHKVTLVDILNQRKASATWGLPNRHMMRKRNDRDIFLELQTLCQTTRFHDSWQLSDTSPCDGTQERILRRGWVCLSTESCGWAACSCQSELYSLCGFLRSTDLTLGSLKKK